MLVNWLQRNHLLDLLREIRTGGESSLLIRKHDHYTLARKMRRDVRATARNHPEGRLYHMELLSGCLYICHTCIAVGIGGSGPAFRSEISYKHL